MKDKKRLKILVVIFSLFIISNYPFAAEDTIDPEYISIPEGLSSGTVQSIIQDSYGLMWIGTDNGLHLYDGYKFIRYKNIPGESTSLLADDVWGLAEDRDNNIWVSTNDGISKYIRASDNFINYDFTELFDVSGTSGGRVFNLVVDSQNRVWAASLNFSALLYDEKTDTWNQVKVMKNNDEKPEFLPGIVLGIAEDKEGKIWMGNSENGLNYYSDDDSCFIQVDIQNGYNIDFTNSENRITALYFDPTNTCWLTTRNGIYKYDPKQNSLKEIIEYNYSKLIIWNHLNTIFQDKSGNIWVGNNFRGILKFDGISDDYTNIELAGKIRNKDGSSEVIVTQGMMDNTGILWFGSTLTGILKFDQSKEPFLHYTYSENDKNSISSNQIYGLFESRTKPNNIYVGTRGGGLNLFDEANQSFKQISYRVDKDIFGGSVRSIFEDDDESLWLGTWGDGLVHLDRSYREITRYVNDTLSVNSLSDNSVRVLRKINDTEYLIGTNSGLNILNPKNGVIKRIGSLSTRVYTQKLYDLAHKLAVENSKTSINKVEDFEDRKLDFTVIKPRKYFVFASGEGLISDKKLYDYGWIENSAGDTIWNSVEFDKTFHFGGAQKNRVVFDIIDLKPGKYTLRYISDDSHSFKEWNADSPVFPEYWGITVAELENEGLIGTIESYIKESNNKFLIEGNNIRSLHVQNDVVWIGTDQFGLNKINWEDNSVTTYSFDENNPNSLSNNSVQFIHEDLEGNIWLATNLGLNKFDPVNESFEVYTEEDGLPTNYIASILPGNSNELWLATRNGISKMVTDTETGQVTFVNYDSDDGLGGMDFIALVALKTSDGRYLFGGEHGLNSFTPGESNTTEPNLVFTDIKLSNKSIRSWPKDESPVENSIFDLNEINLSHDQNDLTFEFSALHYSKPSKNQYAHRLIGYEKEWSFNNKREATYTNLDPGEYTFSFKGSNRDGVWSSKPKNIDIVIHPPWWFTTWAYIGYGMLLIAGVFAVDRIQRRRLISKMREKRRIEEAELRAETAELQARASEAERKVLESEFSQKKKELEEARELQLSMLPKELPQIPHLDIAVYMKTATEVGGDYYDFHIGMDGTLTVVLGDATGHGMKAGTMVTTTKSLFNVLAPNPNIVETFHEMTRCLKLMHMEKLSMCMSMLKIMGNKIQMSSAGMPPIFIYKRESQLIEEHLIKGMPLGTFNDFPYSIVESSVESGDTILMMSDGFPELINDDKEMFGYKRTRNLFEELSGYTPEEIIKKLKDVGTEWTNDKEPDDDITFVVIKVK